MLLRVQIACQLPLCSCRVDGAHRGAECSLIAEEELAVHARCGGRCVGPLLTSLRKGEQARTRKERRTSWP